MAVDQNNPLYSATTAAELTSHPFRKDADVAMACDIGQEINFQRLTPAQLACRSCAELERYRGWLLVNILRTITPPGERLIIIFEITASLLTHFITSLPHHPPTPSSLRMQPA